MTKFRCENESVSHCFDWPLTRGARSLFAHAPFWSGRAGPRGCRAAADFAAAGAAISQRSRSPSLRIQRCSIPDTDARRERHNRRRTRTKQPPARTSRGSGQGRHSRRDGGHVPKFNIYTPFECPLGVVSGHSAIPERAARSRRNRSSTLPRSISRDTPNTDVD